MKTRQGVLSNSRSHEDWIPLMDTAAREVFELMLNCKLAVPTAPDETPWEVTSMVGLAGELCGLLSVRCDGKTAAFMASKMLGAVMEKIGPPEVADAIGEVCNMIAGNFKNKISGLSERCMLSPPTVITGSDYEMRSLLDSPTIEVRLLFEGMPILISLQIHA